MYKNNFQKWRTHSFVQYLYGLHKTNPCIIHKDTIQERLISDFEWVNLYHEFQTDTHETFSNQTDPYRLLYIFPKSLIQCCARNNCSGEDNTIYCKQSNDAACLEVHRRLEQKSESKICTLCCNYTCSQKCIGKFNFCLHCENKFLCSNGLECVGYGGNKQELLPNWLLKKSRVNQDYQVEQYQSSKCFCKDCGTTICGHCVKYFCKKLHPFILCSMCLHKSKSSNNDDVNVEEQKTIISNRKDMLVKNGGDDQLTTTKVKNISLNDEAEAFKLQPHKADSILIKTVSIDIYEKKYTSSTTRRKEKNLKHQQLEISQKEITVKKEIMKKIN